MSDLLIRDGNETDLVAVARLWQRLNEYHHSLGLKFPQLENAPNLWIDSFRRTLGRFSFLWLAESAGKPQAFLLARVKQSAPFLGAVQVGEISDLFVADELRGAGVASQLVDRAMHKFGELAIHSVEVQIQAGNQTGLDFWLKQDFEPDLTLVRKVF
ncbi:MAG TPA: GNAT family N-acetyltransferase [Terriglobales bacterium]|nr:GNAT family N-acetyltransferase [Terriglobales bacterium]